MHYIIGCNNNEISDINFQIIPVPSKQIITKGYFDHYQSENENEPLAIGGFYPWKKFIVSTQYQKS